MKLKRLALYASISAVAVALAYLWFSSSAIIFEQPEIVPETVQKAAEKVIDPLSDPEEYYKDWKRPDGPLRVGLQAGHWKNDELPEELENLETNGGTTVGKTTEWEVNLAIAEETKTILENEGVVVDLLPAAIPPEYWADAFVSIHADGSENSKTAGFKAASPRRDLTGKAEELKKIIEEKYQAATKMQIDPNITRNMTGYYAFNWRRYEHAIHPMTPAAILETGFLTNYFDRQVLATNPKLPAQGLAEALLIFLNT